MEAGVLAALITGICAIIGNLIITKSEGKKTDAKRLQDKEERAVKQAVRDTELKNLIEDIQQRLDIHNGYAEKFALMSERFEEIDKAIVSMQKDIEYLRKGA